MRPRRSRRFGAVRRRNRRRRVLVRVAGLQRVAQPVAERVVREDRQRDRGAGDQQLPRIREQREVVRVPEHVPPARRGGLRREAEEAQAGLGEERPAERQGRGDDQRGADVGQDPAQEDPPGRDPDRSRRVDVGLVLDRQRGAAHQPDEARQHRDGDRDRGVAGARTEHPGDRQREDECGKAQARRRRSA